MKIGLRILCVIGLLLLGVFLVGLFSSKGSNERRADANDYKEVQHHLLSDEVERSPAAVHVRRYVVFDEPASREEVEMVMQAERAGAIGQYPEVTNLGVYGFVSDETAQDGMGTWIAITFSRAPFGVADIQFDDERLGAAWQPSSEKFGLSEPERRALFKELVLQEDRATAEAEKLHPGNTRSELSERADTQSALRKKYVEELAQERGIPVDTLRAISVEALTKGWPFPN